MREYFLEDWLHPNGGITIKCKDDNDCVFCKHCTDVFWDYKNLIYMIICDLSRDPWDRPCACFIEEHEGDKEMKDLKPCPFCGGVAFVQKDGDQYFIKCLHKDTCYLVGRKSRKYNVPEAMIKMWNRREDPDLQLVNVERPGSNS